MKNFELLEPNSLEEALALMVDYGSDAKPLAGGTDLIVELIHGSTPPANLVDLCNIENLAILEYSDGLHIGATTSLHCIDQSASVREEWEMLSGSARVVGSRQIRNLATIGGNICNAVPSADTAPPLLAAEADVIIAGGGGNRTVPLADFFKGPRKTVLAPDELLLKFVLPIKPDFTGSVYKRHTPRKALDLAMVGVAVCVTIDTSEIIRSAKIALGAVGPVPFRATDAEQVLIGHTVTDELLTEAAELAVRASRPISDVRGSADYRRSIVRTLTQRGVREAFERAKREVHQRVVPL